MLAIADPSARLKLVWTRSRAGVADGGEGLRQQHQQRDHDADGRQRRPGGGDDVLDRRGLDLRQAHHRHQRHEQEPQAR
jgi:hypothetical protein